MAKFKSFKTETCYTQESVDALIQDLRDKGKEFNVEYQYDYDVDLYVFVVTYEI